ncbi:cytochrome b [Variovorax sp. J22G73]|jgi:cytochrome b561|uniref:cytochrome b n=1 Tax=unclassified Variovorax TaxID=663243 RepID=UPI002575D389|nr:MULTISPECIES: cytochrome b [unclassified Variovorax]MDM0009242.1 cytochrome b [Variovorax sp. J22R203]MDM0101822.1 cytochrome b [Variovorax sp. J22G73]
MSADTPSLPLDPRVRAPRYDGFAIALHWLLAALIIGSLGVGLFMTGLPFSPLRLKMYSWHKWAGVTILALSALRLLWRAGHRPPALPPGMSRLQLASYRVSHTLMYLLFFAVPISGWAYSSAMGMPVAWFGVLALPDFMPVDHVFAEAALQPLHKYCAFALAGVTLLHVAAVCKHHWIDRDGLMQRMWPAPRKESDR